jgi:predicted NAD/FAD-binding protein
VTLNPWKNPAREKLLTTVDYQHPKFSDRTHSGWEGIRSIQGKNRTWFCGSWCGYGLHEDGLSSGLAVGEILGGVSRPWLVNERSPAGKNCSPEKFSQRISSIMARNI